jgi:hypothetical protein
MLRQADCALSSAQCTEDATSWYYGGLTLSGMSFYTGTFVGTRQQ